mmetsp:Transcript_18224/g.32439  ORF Transcript_18224/g.32439 Transcript_18224/m.32439 type:complete len:106 (+) Transcript_18224:256-573(+)
MRLRANDETAAPSRFAMPTLTPSRRWLVLSQTQQYSGPRDPQVAAAYGNGTGESGCEKRDYYSFDPESSIPTTTRHSAPSFVPCHLKVVVRIPKTSSKSGKAWLG